MEFRLVVGNRPKIQPDRRLAVRIETNDSEAIAAFKFGHAAQGFDEDFACPLDEVFLVRSLGRS